MSLHKANLDAWQVLQTVIEAGGFAQAAHQLGRSQSAISYSIAKLQEQLGLDLLTIQGRRAVLTEHGALLLARSRDLLAEYDHLLELADALQKGHEPELILWLDEFCPTSFLKPVLGEFQTHFPQTIVTIHQGRLPRSDDGDQDNIDLAITTQPLWEYGYSKLGEFTFVAVAHSNHPLMGYEPPLSHSVLENHRQVVLTPTHSLSDIPDEPNQRRSTWFVSSLQQAKEAVLIGQAYAWLPREMIEAELAVGTLRPLPLEREQSYPLPLYLQLNEHARLKQRNQPAVQVMRELIDRYFTWYRSSADGG